jgi:hypothetical protein
MTMGAMKALPGLARTLADMETALRGRMATVERVDGHMVTVTIVGLKGATGPYPATVTGLSVGDVGVVLPLQGGSYCFVPVGESLSQAASDARYLPAGGAIAYKYSTPMSTTLADGNWAIWHDDPFVLPPGEWSVTFDLSALISRSVNTGEAVLGFFVRSPAGADVFVSTEGYNNGDIDLTRPTSLRVTAAIPIGTVTTETWIARVVVRGGSTAGTTTVRRGQLLVTWRRTG